MHGYEHKFGPSGLRCSLYEQAKHSDRLAQP